MKAIISTSANPLHFGHIELYNEAKNIFGEENIKLIIGKNINKELTINQIAYHLTPYKIKTEMVCNKTLADYCAENGIDYIVRGIRNGVDAEYELKLDYINKEINKSLKTLFFPTKDIYSNISSTTIRELLNYKKYNVAKKYMNYDALFRYMNKEPNYLVYFGKSCCGKSTYLKNIYKSENIIDVDKLLWETLAKIHDIQKTNDIKNESKNTLLSGNNLNILIQEYSTQEFWDKFFELVDNYKTYNINTLKNFEVTKKLHVIDFAAIGSYWDTIPIEYKTKFYLIKIENSDEMRKVYIKKKNFENIIDILDKNYLDPPYFDETIKFM